MPTFQNVQIRITKLNGTVFEAIKLAQVLDIVSLDVSRRCLNLGMRIVSATKAAANPVNFHRRQFHLIKKGKKG